MDISGEQSPTELGVKYNTELNEAKTGVASFSTFLENSSKITYPYFLQTPYGSDGRCLQATFLGLKPACLIALPSRFFIEVEEDVPAEVSEQTSAIEESLTKLPQDLTSVIVKGRVVVFNPKKVKAILAQNSDLFKDYSDDIDLGEYIKKLLTPQERASSERLGLLYGYPRNAVESFQWNPKHMVQAMGFTYGVEEISPEDKELQQKVSFIFQASGMNDLVSQKTFDS